MARLRWFSLGLRVVLGVCGRVVRVLYRHSRQRQAERLEVTVNGMLVARHLWEALIWRSWNRMDDTIIIVGA